MVVLGVITATLCVATWGDARLAPLLALHAAMLLGFIVGMRAGLREIVRVVAVVGVLFTLYGTLADVAFAAIPWSADPWLERADEVLFPGRAPVLAAQSLGQAPWAGWLSVGYALFIPYLWLSLLLALPARPPAERGELLTGLATLYALSFLGYLFLPARGPIIHMAGQFAAPIDGGAAHRFVVSLVERGGGPHGAFPSLHLGASLYLAMFDLRHRNPLRALIYIPLVATIAVATIALRYHYLVDLVAAIALVVVADHIARAAARSAPAHTPAAGPMERAA